MENTATLKIPVIGRKVKDLYSDSEGFILTFDDGGILTFEGKWSYEAPVNNMLVKKMGDKPNITLSVFSELVTTVNSLITKYPNLSVGIVGTNVTVNVLGTPNVDEAVEIGNFILSLERKGFTVLTSQSIVYPVPINTYYPVYESPTPRIPESAPTPSYSPKKSDDSDSGSSSFDSGGGGNSDW